MKNLFLTTALVISTFFNSQAQKANNFDVKKFEKELIKQMEIQFPGLTLDTTLNFATRATSQEEAGFPECYASKRGGMVNTANDEKAEAIRIAKEYRSYVRERLFSDEGLKRGRFTEFCATATEQYGGLVRYGIVIDNNITRESIINSSEELIEGN